MCWKSRGPGKHWNCKHGSWEAMQKISATHLHGGSVSTSGGQTSERTAVGESGGGEGLPRRKEATGRWTWCIRDSDHSRDGLHRKTTEIFGFSSPFRLTELSPRLILALLRALGQSPLYRCLVSLEPGTEINNTTKSPRGKFSAQKNTYAWK